MTRILLTLAWLILSAASAFAGSHGGYPAPVTLTPNGSWAGTATACYPNGGGASGCLSSTTYGSGWSFMPVSYFDEPTGYQNQSTGMVAASSITDPNYQICVGYPDMGAPTGTRPAPTYVNFWMEGNQVKVTTSIKSNKGTWGYCINPRGRAGGSPLNGFASLCAEIVPQNGPSQAICMELDLQNGAGATTRARNTYYLNSLDSNASDANDGSRLTYLSPGVGPWKTALCHLNGSISGCTPATQVASGCIDIMVQAGSYINENNGNTFPVVYGGSGVCVDRVMSTASNCTKQTLGNCFTLDDTGPYTLYPNAPALQFIGADAIYMTSGEAIGYTTGSSTPSSVWFKNSVIRDTYGSQCGPVAGGCNFQSVIQFAGGVPGGSSYAVTASVTESQFYGVSSAHMKLCRNSYVETGQEIFDLGSVDSNSASFNCTYNEPYWTMYSGFQQTVPGPLTIQSAAVVSGTSDPVCSYLAASCLKILWTPTNITSVYFNDEQVYTAGATFSNGGTTVTSTLSPGSNQAVWFVPNVGSSLPSNISPQTIYYAENNTGTTFNICATSGCGGGPITFTGSGSGTLTAAKGLVGPPNPEEICMVTGTGNLGGRQLGQWNPGRGAQTTINAGEIGCFNFAAQTQWAGTNASNGYATYYVSDNGGNGTALAAWDTCIATSGATGCPVAGDIGAPMDGQHQNWYRINNAGNANLQNLLYIQGAKINTNGATNLGQGGNSAAQSWNVTTSGTTATIASSQSAATFAANVVTLANSGFVTQGQQLWFTGGSPPSGITASPSTSYYAFNPSGFTTALCATPLSGSSCGSPVTFGSGTSTLNIGGAATLCNGDIVAVPSLGQYHTVMSTVTPANTYQFGDPNSCSSNVTVATLDGPFLASVIPNNGPILTAVTGDNQGASSDSWRTIIPGSQITSNSLGYTVFTMLTAVTSSFPVHGWSICQQSSGVSCGANPVTNLTVGGVDPSVTPVTCAGAATAVCLYSDPTNFAISTSNNYIMTVDEDSGTGNLPRQNTGVGSVYYQNNASNATFSGTTVTLANSGFVYSNEPVTFTLNGGTLPSPLVVGTTYYVYNPSGFTTSLCATPLSAGVCSGGAISFGSGYTQYVRLNIPYSPSSNCANGNTNASSCATAPTGAWTQLTGQQVAPYKVYSQANAPNAAPAEADITTGTAWTRVRSWTNFGCYSCAVNVVNGGNMDQTPQGYVNWIFDHFTYANTSSQAFMSFNISAGANGLNNWIMRDSITTAMGGTGFSSIGSGANRLSFPDQFFGLLNDNVDAVLSSSQTFYAGINMTNQVPAFAQATSPFGNLDARPTLTNGGALCAYAAGSWGSCPLTQQSLDPNPGMDANGDTFGPGTPRRNALVGAVQPQ